MLSKELILIEIVINIGSNSVSMFKIIIDIALSKNHRNLN